MSLRYWSCSKPLIHNKPKRWLLLCTEPRAEDPSAAMPIEYSCLEKAGSSTVSSGDQLNINRQARCSSESSLRMEHTLKSQQNVEKLKQI